MAATDRTIQAITRMITDGSLTPGDRLPPEKELSEQIGVSRNSLREAVKALSVLRVLDVRRGDGTYVTALTPDLLMQTLGFLLELPSGSQAAQATAVRRLLEPEAVALACGNISEERFAHLEEIMQTLREDTPVDDLVQADIRFHHLINSCCGNDYLTSLLDSFASVTTRARIWRGLTQESSVSTTLREHRQILDALRAGRPDLARVYAAAHVAGVESWFAQASCGA
ncbi:FadR family transcriptional regulator [Brachybacterium sp. EF45031]|nr:FadR family transcriptional regulator [Brachybacterium sillae]